MNVINFESLGLCATVLMGQSPPSAACSENADGLPFIQGNAEFGIRHPTPRLRCTAPTRIAEAGDMLISVRAPVGEINQAETRTVIGRGLSAVRVEEEMRAFLWHALKWVAPQLNRIAQGSTFVAVGRSEVEALEIPWSDPQTCSRIAVVLDTVDAAIAQTETMIAKLKQVRAGLLHDLLTRGLDEHGQLRPPPAEAPHLYQNTPLGKIPRGWEVKTLSSLCRYIGSGVTPRGGQEVYTSSGVTFIRSQNVTFDGLLLDDVAFIPEEIHVGMLRSEVFAHDVLFNITGASIGRCCVLPEGLGKTNVNQNVCALRIAAPTALDGKYLASILASNIGQHQMEALNTIGNRQGLNYQQLGSFVISWPAQDERHYVSQRINTFEQVIHSESKERDKLMLLKSALMTDLLTGRVRVPAGVEVQL